MLLTTLLLIASSPAAQQHPIDITKTMQAPGLVLSGSGPGAGIQATNGSDDFNRANSGDLGPAWSLQTGSIGIDNHRASSLANWSLSTINGVNNSYADSVMSAKVEQPTPGVFYIAMVAGYASTSDNVFVKVQDNTSDGLLDRVFFYFGNNGGAWNSSSYYFDLATPTATCTMRLSFANGGDTAVLEIENDASGQTETFSSDGLLPFASRLGDGFGLGTYGTGFADDYNAGSGGPSLTAEGAPGGWMRFTTDGASPGGGVALMWATGPGGFVIPNGLPCAGTMIGLRKPLGFVLKNADAAGTMVHAQLVPIGALGVAHLQAIDTFTCELSNIVTL